MDSGSFYGRGLSFPQNQMYGPNVGNVNTYAGDMYGDPAAAVPSTVAPPTSNVFNQKLDRIATLVSKQNTISEQLKQETSDLRKEVATLKSELAGIKQQVSSPSNSSTSVDCAIRKKIPSQLSVSLKYILYGPGNYDCFYLYSL